MHVRTQIHFRYDAASFVLNASTPAKSVWANKVTHARAMGSATLPTTLLNAANTNANIKVAVDPNLNGQLAIFGNASTDALEFPAGPNFPLTAAGGGKFTFFHVARYNETATYSNDATGTCGRIFTNLQGATSWYSGFRICKNGIAAFGNGLYNEADASFAAKTGAC